MKRFCITQLNYRKNLFVVEVKLFGLITIKRYKYKEIEKAVKKLVEL
jgi:hypothetical protein